MKKILHTTLILWAFADSSTNVPKNMKIKKTKKTTYLYILNNFMDLVTNFFGGTEVFRNYEKKKKFHVFFFDFLFVTVCIYR